MAAVADHGRDRAFERLYARYVRDVYRYVLAVLRNPAEAEDVTQTTFLNAYRAMQAGEEPQKPHNWLIAIAHNACRSRMRFARRRPAEVPLDVLVEQLEVPEAERPNIGELLHALGRLPFNQRAAITMRELEGRSHAEIAETLGVTVPAAEALIGRARRTLRSQAQAIKGLTVVQLPQSLRGLLRSGEAAGGAAGSAAVAKAVAVLAAGVVAGGVGLAGKGDAQSPDAAPPQTLQPRALIAVAAPHAHARRARAALGTPVATHRARRAAASTYSASAGRRPRIDTSGDATPPPARPAPAADAPAPAQSSAPAASQPVDTVETATTSTSTSAVETATTAVTSVTQPVQQVVDTVASAVTTVANTVPPPPTVPAVPAVPPPPPPPTVTVP
jgi:RNA polymerase sigma factor (sigma-70 family)